jgi:hypothetical protein
VQICRVSQMAAALAPASGEIFPLIAGSHR